MVYFRADCNEKIASGHIMRCLTLAREFSRQGKEVTFVCADDGAIDLIEKNGYFCIVLNTAWDNLDIERELIVDLLCANSNSLYIIDTYSVTPEYVSSLLPYAKICYLGSKKIGLGNLYALINYSTDIDFDFYSNVYSPKTKLLLGPKFAPLREEFCVDDFSISKDVKRVLITTGNTDSQNFVGQILSALVEKASIVTFDVILGSMFKYAKELKAYYADFDNVIFHEKVTDLSPLMKMADIAISANGTTVYELAASGVPTITFAMVEEQIKSAKALSVLGAICYCGTSYDNSDLCLKTIRNNYDIYFDHYEYRKNLSDTAHNLIDGCGSKRIVDTLLNWN